MLEPESLIKVYAGPVEYSRGGVKQVETEVERSDHKTGYHDGNLSDSQVPRDKNKETSWKPMILEGVSQIALPKGKHI